MYKKIHSVILIVVTAAILSGCKPADGQETTVPTEGGVTTVETVATTKTTATEVLGETMPSMNGLVFPIDITIREDFATAAVYRTLFRANIWETEQRLTIVRRLAEGEQVTVVAKVGAPELQYALLDSGEYVLFVLLEPVTGETTVTTTTESSAASTSTTTKAPTSTPKPSQTTQATTQTTTQTTTQATTQATTQSTTTQTTKAPTPTPKPTPIPTPTPVETKSTEWYENPDLQPKSKNGMDYFFIDVENHTYYEVDNNGKTWAWNPNTSEWMWDENRDVRFPGSWPDNYPWPEDKPA